MKKFGFLVLIAVAISKIGWSQQNQPVTNDNYYNYFKGTGSVNWLRTCDVVPIIIDELKKKGIPYYEIGVGNQVKVNDTAILSMTVSFRMRDEEYGFVFEDGHEMFPDVKDRTYLKDKTSSYTQVRYDANGKVNWVQIKHLPPFVFLLRERCYWFEGENSGTTFPVNRNTAEEILRRDIDAFLTRM